MHSMARNTQHAAFTGDGPSRVPRLANPDTTRLQVPQIRQSPRKALAQAKLTIGAPDDEYEQEADRVADQVMRMPDSRTPSRPIARENVASGVRRSPESEQSPPRIQRLCADCEDELQRQVDDSPSEEEEVVQTKPFPGAPRAVSAELASGIRSIRNGGQSLAESNREFFEPRFGRNFSEVRIHADARAAELARSVNARAFTLGRDIVFGAGQYRPHDDEGRRLMAHELTHVVQQGAARNDTPRGGTAAPPVTPGARDDHVQAAWFHIGKQRIDVNYDDVILTPTADFASKIEALYVSWTGAADATAISAPVAALTPSQQQWVLLGLDLLRDNTKSPAHSALDRQQAVTRLLARAPSTTTNIATPNFAMERETLQITGWLEVALASHVTAPSGKKLAKVKKEFFPPTAAGTTSTTTSTLIVADLKTRLKPALKHFINAIDPRSSTSMGTRHLPTLKKLGDTIIGEAKSYYAPYSHSARSSVFSPVHSGFKISKNIESTAVGIDKDLRVSYLLNRGKMVGSRRKAPNFAFIDQDIFYDTNYNHSIASDRKELRKIAEDVETDTAIQPIVNALIALTGRQHGRVEKAKIWLPLKYRTSRYPTGCDARWRVVRTLSHEVLHALSHPTFHKKKVGASQIIREGFTEVLGAELFNKRVIPKSKSTATFKGDLEQGLSSTPCPDPSTTSIGYDPAGPAAERIRKTVGDDNFRAAYFLGALDKVGL